MLVHIIIFVVGYLIKQIDSNGLQILWSKDLLRFAIACSSELPGLHRCPIWRDEIPSGVCHSARVDLLGDDKYLCG